MTLSNIIAAIACVFLQVSQEQSPKFDEVEAAALTKSIPATPRVLDEEVMARVEMLAKSQDERAIKVLIKALVYNRPLAQNESRPLEEMIPAVKLLKKYFGEKSLPSLYEEGIRSSDAWARQRLALAVRSCTTPERRAELQTAYAGRVEKPHARDAEFFFNLIQDEHLRVDLYDNQGGVIDKLDARLQKGKEKSRP